VHPAIALAPLGALLPLLLLASSITPTTTPAVKVGVIPATYQQLVTDAAGTCPELSAPLLAAQIDTESSWNPTALSPAGAQGIAQFLPATWTTYGVDGNNDGRTDPYDPADAIPAQARYMCALIAWATSSGIPGAPIQLALAAYNAGPDAVTRYHGIPPFPETQAYVTGILAKTRTYTGNPTATQSIDGLWDPWQPPPASLTIGDYGYPTSLSPVTNQQIAQVIAFALNQVGKPYEFGAHGPDTWDCSGIIQVAYNNAGITIGAWTGTQQHDGTRITNITNLSPGDLVFIPGSDGTPQNPQHVGLYLGDQLILQAPQTGDYVRVTPLANWTESFAFAQRIPL
jgi:cell wall-associated NlpC family hydrolase